jgi:DeoR/GlpR family transcriptional regulator of sugar metabolism
MAIRTTARRDRIIQLAKSKGFVRSSELSDMFGVSTVTIRQDLDFLGSQGLLKKTYGGAIAQGEPTLDSEFSQRAMDHADQKHRIGARAASIINAGETILLDAGSTTIEIAKNLPESADLTVVTCAINVAMEAVKRAGVSVVLCGGALNPRTLSVSGPYVDQALEDFHADRLFLATYSVNIEKGLGERNFSGAQTKRSLLRAAQQITLVCDSSKFGATSPVVIAPLDVVQHVITDGGTPQEYLDFFASRQVEVDVV